MAEEEVRLEAEVAELIKKAEAADEEEVRWSPKFRQVVKSGFCSYN